jgi:hypothetical protein
LLLSAPLRDAVRTTQFYAQPLSKLAAGTYVREWLPHGAPTGAGELRSAFGPLHGPTLIQEGQALLLNLSGAPARLV